MHVMSSVVVAAVLYYVRGGVNIPPLVSVRTFISYAGRIGIRFAVFRLKTRTLRMIVGKEALEEWRGGGRATHRARKRHSRL